MTMLDSFWSIISDQLEALRTATSADDVMSVLSVDGRAGEVGFFGGSGGDEQVCEALLDAGWSYVWAEADYYWAIKAPDGSVITYVEGDVYRANQRPKPTK